MARVVPAEFDPRSLPPSEVRVLEALRDGLDDTWVLVPSVRIAWRGRDVEIDLLIVHPARGVVVVETKGGVITLSDGVWNRYGSTIRNPFEQVMKAKHTLLEYLRGARVDISGLFVQHAVALPDVAAAPEGGAGPDAPAEAILTRAELADPGRSLARLLHTVQPVPSERVDGLLAALLPEVTFEDVEAGYFDRAERVTDRNLRLVLGAVVSLDANRRVLVSGGAGTGKSWLVRAWAQRAAERGERVVVVCFNRPMADLLGQLLDLPAMTYHELVLSLLEPLGYRVPETADRAYWEREPTELLMSSLDRVGRPFDTIVVDEAQDLRPGWRESLYALLDPQGSRRLLMVADPAQAIYTDWEPPLDVVRAELVFNLRNAPQIARWVADRGGAEPFRNNPAGARFEEVRLGGWKEARKYLRGAVDRVVGEHRVDPERVAILTTSRSERDRLFADPPVPLAAWEDRGPGRVLCETIHRTKGLEYTVVFVVASGDQPDERLLYIGGSRARMRLTLLRLA